MLQIQNYIQEPNIESCSLNYCSQSSIVSIMIRLWAGWSEVQTLVWTRDSSLLENVQTCSRASLLVSGYRGSFLEVKQPGYEVNHSLLTSVEIKIEGSYTSPPLYAFVACMGKTTFLPQSLMKQSAVPQNYMKTKMAESYQYVTTMS
jgi:hypothetical protein